MQTIIGPVLARSGLYGFDTWSGTSGLCRGFGYRRIEDAYYARNATLAGDTRAIPCGTLDAFLAEVEDASAGRSFPSQAVAAQPALAA
jgi:hypothetical protein